MTLFDNDLTKLVDTLREDAARNIERLLAEKLKELETFKTDAIAEAERIVADKIRKIEDNRDSFEQQSLYRWDETGLWVPAPPLQTALENELSAYPVPPPLPMESTPRNRSTFAIPPPPPPLPTEPSVAKISVAMSSLGEISAVGKDQIRVRPISARNRRPDKTNWNRSGLFLLLALEFALGFGLCYWWWNQWYENQPFIELKPNARGVFVSPKSIREFYDGIRSNHSFAEVEKEWKFYETNFRRAGSTVGGILQYG